MKQLTLSPTAYSNLHAEAIERILREARAAAKIHHPRVAAVYDVVSNQDSPYIVMQLIQCRPLAELIAEQVRSRRTESPRSAVRYSPHSWPSMSSASCTRTYNPST